MKTALIISGGEYAPLPDNLKSDYCIACDKGYRYALDSGIRPDVIIGDFDSMERPADTDGIPVLTFPIEKDDSDTMLAIKHAMKMGLDHILIVCGLGGRLDHTIANIQSAAYVASHGGVCEILSEKEYLRTLTGGNSVSIPENSGHSLSLFSLSDSCTGLTIRGAKYNVENETIKNTFPLGLSNRWLSGPVEVSLKEGILLIVESSM